MTKVILNKSILHQLKDLKEELEVCDEAGKTLGHFIPQKECRPIPFSNEELDRFEKEPGGRSLAEILDDLEKLP